jgi:hypothetical protein
MGMCNKQTQDEFIAEYVAAFPHKTFGSEDATHCVLQCTCEDGGGPTHWAAIRNTKQARESHFEDEESRRDMRLDAAK